LTDAIVSRRRRKALSPAVGKALSTRCDNARSVGESAGLGGAQPARCGDGLVRSTRYRLNRGNNRRLNHAIHVIALTQARNDPRAQAFLAHSRAQGKTSREAMRALKPLRRRLPPAQRRRTPPDL
jgi:hypothetical protein